jgi:hypothetical protein
MDKHLNQEILSDYINELQFGGTLSKLSYQNGKKLYELGRCHLLSSTPNEYQYEVYDDYHDFNVKLFFDQKEVNTQCNCGSAGICAHVYACLNQTQQEINRSFLMNAQDGLQYSREGMMKRVLEERRKRAAVEEYQIQFAENIHGEHILTTSQNKKYDLSFYDFDKNLGYCSCPDYQTNKLETCKHLIYAFDTFESEMGNNELPNQPYPFLEIFRHPLKDYKISWFYPQKAEDDLMELLQEYFDDHQIWKEEKWSLVHQFVEKASQFKLIKIRPEVSRLIEEYYEEEGLKQMFEKNIPYTDVLPKALFPYQIEGAKFVATRKGSFLADEIGLGKSAQALAAALLKIKYSRFTSVHIICPDEIVHHWENEIIKWVPEPNQSLFHLFGMSQIAQSGDCDFLIIDEAQKIDGYESGLVSELSRLKYQHILLITDSKYENSLMKFHAISTLIDSHMLTPLWELSYKHCLFDPKNPEKIIAYHHLDLIGKKLEKYYLRREREEVINQLPPAQLMEVPVALNNSLKSEQSLMAKKISSLCKKEYLNKYDWVQFRSFLKELLQLSAYSFSSKYTALTTPKMHEFLHFIQHKLNLGSHQKLVVFAEGKDLQNQILRALNQERLNADIFDEGQVSDTNNQYFITSEDGLKDLSFAQHFVYFHLPKKPALIEKRMQEQVKSQSGIEHSLFYLLKSVNSFESIVFDWQKNKPHFIQQLLNFIYNKSSQQDVSLRLREELDHEMASLILEEIPSEVKEIQMDLFGNQIPADFTPKTAQHHPNMETENELQLFFKSLMSSWKIFEELPESKKNLLKTGHFKVENKDGEILIRIRKK